MRPYVICHMCTSLDGRIIGDRWGKLPGYRHESQLFETTAASFGIGAWLVGTTTMDEFDGRKGKLPRAKEIIPRRDYIANPKAKTLGIGADAKGVLRFQNNEVGGDHVVLLVTDRASNDYLAHLQAAGVSYLFCGKVKLNLPMALKKLGSAGTFGLRKLMLQGGGAFNGAMLQAGLVDEISHITVPVADGGEDVATMFDGGLSRQAAAKLRLFSHKILPGGAVWCRYKVTARR